MPIYEYKCLSCGYRFAMLEPVGSPEKDRECPICHETKTRREISSFATKQTDEKGGRGCKPGG